MPRPHATPEQIRDVNVRYHDAAADEYDSKWGIDFGEIGRGRCCGSSQGARAAAAARLRRALEIGAGTGYFTLNLLQAA